MKKRFYITRRRNRGGVFYCIDSKTGKRTSLETEDLVEAQQLVSARNQAERQPVLNLQMAKVYLAGSDSGINTRSWEDVFKAVIETKKGSTQERWIRASKEKPFDLIRTKVVIETQADELFKVLKVGTVSTNVHLRKIQNFCLGMNWLPWPIIPKKLFPPVKFQAKRAITAEEHLKIIAREKNPERQAFYEICWHLGGSQGDVAALQAEDIDWTEKTIAYRRKKTSSPALIHFGDEVEQVLLELPKTGALFPSLIAVRASDRATEFKQRCAGLGISGVTLHSYRYAWAERARKCGYPERFAQTVLGHNSAAVHRAYAKNAHMKLPSLEEYEKSMKNKVVEFPGTRKMKRIQTA